jgi:hypothetical protein
LPESGKLYTLRHGESANTASWNANKTPANSTAPTTHTYGAIDALVMVITKPSTHDRRFKLRSRALSTNFLQMTPPK